MNLKPGEDKDKEIENSFAEKSHTSAKKSDENMADEAKEKEINQTDASYDDLKQKIEALEKALDDKQKEIDEYKSRWYRVQADFDNYRKRTQKEIQEIHLYAAEQLIKDILPVVDNFERALDSIEDREGPVYKGIQLIYQQLKNLLERYEVREIEAVGKIFDPRFHEAVMQMESHEHENDTVIEVLQKGYLYHAKVIRPSMVKVAKK
ncbi:MAG: nucleotide exchange factor GrpE [Tepidanaerobacteraceae bacterium]|jgi:molecular chaperone GrpE|nr:nucleotide exchange factor GrpE [Tepidanaerobacteraceae bacterium]